MPLDAPAWCREERDRDVLRLVVGGDWVIGAAARLDHEVRDLAFGNARRVEIDGAALSRLDSAGAWLLLRTKRRAEAEGREVGAFSLPSGFLPLLHTLERDHTAPPCVLPRRHTFEALLQRIGRGTVHAFDSGYQILGFVGLVAVETVQTIVKPWRHLRLAAFAHQIEETGITALPILGLLGFLLGVVLAYQGADQLRRFGAEIYTVNLVGVAMVREIGVLITAIIVAGRSGSAFTAYIGTMKVNEELDAMETLGINVIEALVMPRVFGLVIALPFITFYTDFMGLVGGGVMCYFDLGINVPSYLRQLQSALTVTGVLVGLVKAPVFAYIIAQVGCFEGLRVQRNAASVGRLTTQSVVESIFLVIVFDAGFSILFSILGI
ncbi:MAG TPA: MlaE family lipid ABC transporter permease subunit [Stellaceae bacterium]|nr:MlaE family lipid ABC transporter permease subunit [Stellaceae bacterium]